MSSGIVILLPLTIVLECTTEIGMKTRGIESNQREDIASKGGNNKIFSGVSA